MNMKRLLNISIIIFSVCSLVLLGFFGKETASAEYYIPGCTGTSNLYSTVTGQPCSQISFLGSVATYYGGLELLGKRELTVGSRGGDVRYIQQFLKAQGFLFGRDDGVFGPITEAALINYQRSVGLAQTGVVDAATFRKMEVSTTLPGNSNSNCPLVYTNGVGQYVCGNNSITPMISTLSPTSGRVGTTVTIYGSGFTTSGNRVKSGELGLENNPNYNLGSNGTTVTFIVPFSNYLSCWYSIPACYAPVQMTAPGTYLVSVINGNGATSNLSYFTVIP